MKSPRLFPCLLVTIGVLLVGVTSSSATLVGAGESFKVSFDLTGKGPSAAYDTVGFLLNFTPLDYLDQNEGFSFQVFDSAGTANSDVTNFLYPLPSPTWNVQTQSQVYTPMSGAGYFLFSNIIGSFDIGGPNLYGFGTMQTAYGYDSATSGYTGVFAAAFEKSQAVPDSADTSLLMFFSLALLFGFFRLKIESRIGGQFARSKA